MPDPREVLAFALDLADEADRLTLSYYRGDLGVTRKQDRSYVTLADQAIEARLRELIATRYPDHAVLGEEQGFSAGAPGAGRWILDPIDGTHGFMRGVPVWGALIAYEEGGAVQVGVASAPALGTRWWAGRGLGAYRGGREEGHAGERIHVSGVSTLAESQVLYGEFKLALDRWPRLVDVLRAAWRDRGYGDFWAHCLVAEGAAEAMLDPVVTAWDLAALSLIVEEAGGVMTDVQGMPGYDHGYAVTSNGRVHHELLRVLRGEA